jgi:hypothetical protein
VRNISSIAFLLADLKSHLKTKCSGLKLASADLLCGFSNGKKCLTMKILRKDDVPA